MKSRCHIIIILIVLLKTNMIGFAQNFTFSSGSPTNTEIKFNAKLKPLLDAVNYKGLEELIKKNPNVINQASIKEKQSGVYNDIDVNKPMLHDVFDRCLEGQYPIEMMKFLLQNGADPYIEYMDLPILYRLLSYFATQPIEKCSKATEIFTLLANTPQIDFTRQHRALLPPFAFLLRSNYSFLKGKYDENYIPPSVIMTFIQKGANANTYDQDGNNLLTYAVQTNNIQIQKYLSENGIEFYKKNDQGHDAMYNAILVGSLESIKEMVKGGYELSPTKLVDMNIAGKINKSNKQLSSYLSDLTFSVINNYTDLKNYILLFDENKSKVLNDRFYLNHGVDRNNVIEFLNMMEKNNPVFSEKEKDIILNEKIRYFNGCTVIAELITAIKNFPLFSLPAYKTDYYSSEKSSADLYNQLSSVNSVYLSSDMREKMLEEIRRKTAEYYQNSFDNIRSVSAGKALAANFPTNKNKIEKRCLDSFCYNIDCTNDGSAYKWSSQISDLEKTLNNYIGNCVDYIDFFSYNSVVVRTNLENAKACRRRIENNYSKAAEYEKQLKENVDRIYNAIKSSSILPDYEIENLNNDEYNVEITEYCQFKGKEKILRKNDDKFYIYIPLFPDDGPYNSISEAIKELCLKKWNANLWTYNPKVHDFEKMEKIIKEFNKYGMNKWYKMQLL